VPANTPEPRGIQEPQLGEVVESQKWEGSTIDYERAAA
jgi:hypothetical protein